MKRYFMQKLKDEQIKKVMENLKNPPVERDEEGNIIQDHIVDRSSYVLDKESVRQARLNAGEGAGNKGIYDNRELSELEIKLRDGKLDKADITQEQLKLQKEIKEKDSKKKQEEKEALRQEAIDNALGTGQKEQTKPEE